MINRSLRYFSSLAPNKALYERLQTRYFKLYDETQAMPLLLRLAWHDAGTYDAKTKTGGPNGSIRFGTMLAHGANAGLPWARDQVSTIKAEFPEVNWADLIQVAGYTACDYCKGPSMTFRFGRKEAGDDYTPTPSDRLPDATQGVQHLRDIFYRMGFDDKEIVALSGAHTLGRAHKDRSGFEGNWTENPYHFDNSYYTELLKKVYNSNLLKLPTDLALLQEPSMREWVEAFGKDQSLFFREYAKAHIKLSELGN